MVLVSLLICINYLLGRHEKLTGFSNFPLVLQADVFCLELLPVPKKKSLILT